MIDNFKFVMPAELSKSEDGEWKIQGLASTESVDQQGETLLQRGLDLTPITEGKGYFNFEHSPKVEDLLGLIDGYNHSERGLVVHGRLFKHSDKAKAIHGIMSSLTKRDSGRIGLSVEGAILERDTFNPKIIKKARIKNIAITLNPVNTDSYVDLMKSMTSSTMEWDASKENIQSNGSKETVFTSAQVLDLISKTLTVGSGYTNNGPSDLKQGDALAQEDFVAKRRHDEIELQKKNAEKTKKEAEKEIAAREMAEKIDCENRRPLKKGLSPLFKSNLIQILDKIAVLYPQCPKEVLWENIKDRLNRKFPELK